MTYTGSVSTLSKQIYCAIFGPPIHQFLQYTTLACAGACRGTIMFKIGRLKTTASGRKTQTKSINCSKYFSIWYQKSLRIRTLLGRLSLGLHTVNTKRYRTGTGETVPVVSVSLTVKRYLGSPRPDRLFYDIHVAIKCGSIPQFYDNNQ